MKDGFKIVILLIILVAMVAGFAYLFKDQKVFEHKKKEEPKIEQKAKTIDEVKEAIKQEGTKDNVEIKASEAAKKEETKKQETKKAETKTNTNTTTKQDSSTQNKTDTPKEESTNNNTQMVFKSYWKPRCVFDGEEDNYTYLMTYEGYFDTQNNYLMDKVTVNYQYAPKTGKLEAVKQEAIEDVNEHKSKGFTGGYAIKDGYVIVNLTGDGKSFGKFYLDGATSQVTKDVFVYIMKLAGATCYNA